MTMTIEEKAKAFDEALERARKMLNMILDNELIGFPDQIREIFPQLCENEDERIRKALVEYFAPPVSFTTVRGIPVQKVRDWLENQKPLFKQISDGVIWHSGLRTGMELEKQQEQKPVECIEFDNEFENQVSHLLASVLNGEWEYNEGFVKHAAQSLMGYAKNEMKPDEWDKREKLFTKALQAANARIGQLFEENRKLKEQKPEWSEEDRLHYVNVLEALEYVKGCKSDYDKIEAIISDIDWLKSLPERFNLQPKQEWTEEDKTNGWKEANLERYLSCLQKLGTGDPQQPETVNSKWFKEHCQPCMVSVKDATKFGNLEYERGIKDGIQSEKSRQWRPSEEQIRAVFDASERNDKLGSVLRNLYGDLRKL